MAERDEDLAESFRKGYEAGEVAQHAHCLADETASLRSRLAAAEQERDEALRRGIEARHAYESDREQHLSIIEWCELAARGETLSEFALSFPEVRTVSDLALCRVAAEGEAERLKAMLLAMPDAPDGMDNDAYTDYCTGADGTKKQPYPQRRNRQCSIGYHDECTDPEGVRCGCPCHKLSAALQSARSEEKS